MNYQNIAKKITYWTARPDASAEHAMEFVANINGVDYVNDAKSITAKSTFDSINSIDAEIVLIIGGKNEETDYKHLLNADLDKIKSFIYLGMDHEKVLKFFGKHRMLFSSSSSEEEAVQTASFAARASQVVLFSPACSGVQEMANFRNRGLLFKKAVKKLEVLKQ